ncbi:hypothetical protein ACQVP2_34525 [Methylobacterium aquaticum]|uniref:hypothetical protein n=1 Tax=Methylobacterium aquaticum TaxID=270351 RepID=UPI003D17CBFA
MIAYIILAHQEFNNVKEFIRGAYHPEDIFCICTNRQYINEALHHLGEIRHHPNIYIISTPITSWGMVLESYLIGIDFCLKVDANWQILTIVSGADVPIKSVTEIRRRAHEWIEEGSIILNIITEDPNVKANKNDVSNLLKTPFSKNDEPLYDAPLYNPFNFPMLNLVRENSEMWLMPDTVRAGWPRKNHSIVLSCYQERDQSGTKIYMKAPNLLDQRLLEDFFKGRKLGYGSIYGFFPRDLCDYSVSNKDALIFYSLTKSAFSMEEVYFATIACNAPFSGRLKNQTTTWTHSVYGERLTADIVLKNISDEHLFARKAPKSEYKSGFYSDIYSALGMSTVDLINGEAVFDSSFPNIWNIFLDKIQIHDIVFSFGTLGGKYICEFVLRGDGTIEYVSSKGELPAGLPAGTKWVKELDHISFLWDDKDFIRITSARIVNNNLLLFGIWHHHPNVALVAHSDLKITNHNKISNFMITNKILDICSFYWSFYLSSEKVDQVRFCPGGFVESVLNNKVSIIGCWTGDGTILNVFGLGDTPFAFFNIINIRSDDKPQISGVALGFAVPVDSCIMIGDKIINDDS